MDGALLLDAQAQAALVELLEHLFERLRTEVRDREEVVLGLLHQLADRVDPGPLEAVARALREVQLLDRELEVRGGRGDRRDLAELQAFAEASASRGEIEPSVSISRVSLS